MQYDTHLGDVIADWPIVRVSDVATVNELSIKKDFQYSEIEYIDISSVNEGKIDAPKRMLRKSSPSRAKRIVRNNDILISTVRPNLKHYAFVKNAKPNTIASTGFAILTPKKINPRFLYYCLTTKKYTEYLVSIAESQTSTYPAFNPDTIEDSNIPKPSDPEQRAIAHILGSLDDKIELNRQMNKTLENMAQAIFKSWFVDFDPVRAKMEGKKPIGMDEETAALFPDKLVWNDELEKEIPEGWENSTVGSEVTIVGGSTPSTRNPKYWGGNIYWTTPKDLSNLSFPILLETERKITKSGLKKISSGLLPKGTVLLSSRAPIGYLAISEIDVAINQGFIGMICNGDLSNYFVLNWTKEKMEIIKKNAGGTTFSEISKKNFRPISLIKPLIRLVNAYDEIVEPIYQKMVLNEKENKTLSSIRNILLPKLISGEIRVDPDEVEVS